MSVFIHRLETEVPQTHYDQSFASELMQKHVGSRDATRRILRNVYHHSGIKKRHSVITDFSSSESQPLFFNNDGTRTTPPDTKTRNDIYAREARTLFVNLAKKLLHGTDGFTKEEVTHVITISCTGFFAPGPDYYVVRELGLSGSVQRYHIGFMGCYAAFQGLKMADAFCRSDPEAVVLVLCVELCTLHLQFSDDTDSMIAASVFSDGGSGALVSAKNPALTDNSENTSLSAGAGKPSGYPARIISFRCDLTPRGEEDMAWTLGNEGFLMRLSTYVPEIIRENIESSLERILYHAGMNLTDITSWAIHPGGRAILDNIQKALGLTDAQMAASRTVLREYGNMSSATILFVLKELLENSESHDKDYIFAMAFGPGLTIESAVLQRAGTGNLNETGSSRS